MVASVGIVSAVLFVVFLVDNQVFKDARYDNSPFDALLLAFVLIPLKTVIFEELGFRGLLAGLTLRLSQDKRVATVISSLLFGLWHVRTAGNIGAYNIGNNLIIPQPLVVAAVLLVTTMAGVVFCILRWRSRSLIAPIGAHWAINSIAVLLAAFAWH